MKRLFIAAMALMMATSCCQKAEQTCQKECCEKECNPVIETIMSRRSIRKYKDEAVSRELLDKIVECGIHAPNGMNAQQWEVRIVDNPEWLKGVLMIHHSAHTAMMAAHKPAKEESELLSQREKEVLALIIKGFINKEIADKLNISTPTVIFHRRNIMEKIGSKSIGRLTIYAVMNGIVDVKEL